MRTDNTVATRIVPVVMADCSDFAVGSCQNDNRGAFPGFVVPPVTFGGGGWLVAERPAWSEQGAGKFPAFGSKETTPMRALRSSWAAATAAALVALGPALADAQPSQTPEPASLLAFKPMLRGVDYDDPASKDEVATCKVEIVTTHDGKEVGFALRDVQGKLLRKFVDTDLRKTRRGKEAESITHIDRWSYFRDGFEVYRESDTNEDGILDEVRWLNVGGTRVGEVKPAVVNGRSVYRIVAWKRISAEEASKVLVQALISGDLALLETVMAKPEEIKSLGLPDDLAKKVTESTASRLDAVKAIQPQLKGWDGETTWARFDGMMPHVIPADAAPGLGKDVLLYENAVIFVNPSGKNADPRSLAYLHVPELIQLGDTWKFLDLPRAVDPNQPVVGELAQGSLRSFLYNADAGAVESESSISPEILKELADHDAKRAAIEDEKTLAQWHLDHIAILKKAVESAPSEADKLNFYKLIVHDLAEAYRTGLYPQGAKVLDDMIAQGGKIGSFAAYRKALAEFDIEADKPGADLQKVQATLVERLTKFLADYPQSDEVPEVLFQIATVHEFNGAEEEARASWTRLAEQHADSPAGKKAAGALHRLDLEGKPLDLSGPTIDGKQASTTDAKGKTLLVLYWMSMTEPDRREIEELTKIYEKFHAKGLEVLSVNLDPDRAALDEYLKTASLPWPVIFEEGGLDSRLANELGIISTPTMILVNEEGQVVSSKIRKASEIEKYLEKPLAARPVGLNLGVK